MPMSVIMNMLGWVTEWVRNGGREMQQERFGAVGVGEGGSRFSLIVEFGGKDTERESTAGLEVLGRAPEVGVSASTLRSSWVPTVGMAILPLLWPLGWGPAPACSHHPFSSFHPAPLAFVLQKWLHNSPKRDVSGLICQSKWKHLWSHNQWEVFKPLCFLQQRNLSFSFSSKKT